MMLDKIVTTLTTGGVALLPTDTVYGLFASPKFPAAVQKIFTLKRRAADKYLPIMVGDIAQLKALGACFTPQIEQLLHLPWVPGPLTLIMALDQAKAPPWLQGRSEIAARLPDDFFLQTLLHATGPLLATSANASGHDTRTETAAILQQLNGAPDVVLNNGARPSAASTLIDTQTTPFTVKRRGALSDTALQQVLAI